MDIFFCKVEDLSQNQYILTDKFKQPIICELKSGICQIINVKKIKDDPILILLNKNETINPFFDDTKILCTTIKDKDGVFVSKPINKSEINFNIYDIATFNKDIVIKDKDDKQYTGIEIEQNFNRLFILDKNNQIFFDKMKQNEQKLDTIADFYGNMYDYNQKLFNKEEYNNCIISDWTPCNSTNSTRTRTRTQATIIGTACTPDENNLLLTQTCNNCIISDWTPCNDTNLTQTRTRTQALNSTACTPDEDNLPLTQSCSLPPSTTESTTESSDNNMYIGIGTFVLFIFVIAFGFYIFKQKNQPNYQYPNQQYIYR
jgi:cbb3-type cytochrome oxidase subunit 3